MFIQLTNQLTSFDIPDISNLYLTDYRFYILMMATNIQIDFLNQIMFLNGLDFSQNSNFPVPVADVCMPCERSHM